MCKLPALVAGTTFRKRPLMFRLTHSGRAARLVISLVLFVAMAFGGLSPVKAQTPSQDQIEAFRNLTPEQQQAILQSVGTGTSGVNKGVGQMLGEKPLDFPRTVSPRPVAGKNKFDA